MKLTINWIKRHINFYSENILNTLDQMSDVLLKEGGEVEEISITNTILKLQLTSKEQLGSIYRYRLQVPEKVYSLIGLGRPYDSNYIASSQVYLIEVNSDIDLPVHSYVSYSVDRATILPTQVETGCIIEKYDDVILNISLPSNQWQMIHVRGIARILSFHNLGQLLPLPTKYISSFKSDIVVSNHSNVLFQYCILKDFSLPEYIKLILVAIGKYSKNEYQSLNDFILLDIGHAIQIYSGLESNTQIFVRTASVGEVIADFKCEGNELLVSANNQYISIAGIKSLIGFDKVSEDIHQVILEVAYIPAEHITSALTNSARSFLLGIDDAQETMHYILHIANTNNSNVIYTPIQKMPVTDILLPYDEIYKISSLALPINSSISLLESRGFKCKSTKKLEGLNYRYYLSVQAPTWRKELRSYYDIIEELIKVYGYDRYKGQPIAYTRTSDVMLSLEDRIILMLVDMSLTEVKNIPFVSQESSFLIKNSINTERPYFRDNLFYSLMHNANTTLAQGEIGVGIFEISYIGSGKDLHLGILLAGNKNKIFTDTNSKYNFFDLKKIVANISTFYNINLDIKIEGDIPYYSQYLNTPSCHLGIVKYDSNYPQVRNAYYTEVVLSSTKTSASKSSAILAQQSKYYKNISIKANRDTTWNRLHEICLKDIISSYTIEVSLFDYFVCDEYINFGLTLCAESLTNLEVAHTMIGQRSQLVQ